MFDLDVATPEEIAPILREAAERYRESASDLRACWQDRQAGRVWDEIARIFERAAVSVDNAVGRCVG